MNTVVGTILCLFLSELVLAQTHLDSNRAGVTGTVLLSKDCKPGRIEVWLSSGRLLIYQAEVPFKGTFEFYTVPGKYNLVATSSSGCFAEASYQGKSGTIQQVDLNLSPVQPYPKEKRER